MKSCVVLSIPRAGTHLIMKLLNMFGMNEFFCYDAKTRDYYFSILPSEGHYAFGAHASPCEKYYSQIKKGIFITRDPRDIAVSTYFNARKVGEYSQLDHLSTDEWLINFIIGGPTVCMGVNKLFTHQLAWRERSGIYSTKYENFMEEESRRKEIMNIANYLELPLTKEKLEYCSKNLLGSNPLYPMRFRKGSSGDWKIYFKKEHRKAFDQVAGSILINEGYEKDHRWANEI